MRRKNYERTECSRRMKSSDSEDDMTKDVQVNQIKCCIYARVSTEEQTERDLSIPFQLERCRYHARGLNWKLVNEFIDAGESARTDKRPEFQKMVTAARAKEFEIILVH